MQRKRLSLFFIFRFQCPPFTQQNPRHSYTGIFYFSENLAIILDSLQNTCIINGVKWFVREHFIRKEMNSYNSILCFNFKYNMQTSSLQNPTK